MRSRSACVCSSWFVVRPFGFTTPCSLLWPLLTSASSRPAFPPVALRAALTIAACSFARGGQLAAAPGPCHPVWTGRVLRQQQQRRQRRRSPQVRTRTVGAQAPHLP